MDFYSKMLFQVVTIVVLNGCVTVPITDLAVTSIETARSIEEEELRVITNFHDYLSGHKPVYKKPPDRLLVKILLTTSSNLELLGAEESLGNATFLCEKHKCVS